MTIRYQVAKSHWNYFLALERDFETVTRFIEPCESNNDTFSLELARLLMTATQEIDVILKLLCNLLDDTQPARNINEYRVVIDASLPGFYEEEITIPRYAMTSKPWADWDNTPPLWWSANNKIKHERVTHFDRATLKNTYNSIGALLISAAHYYKLELAKQDANVTWPQVMDTLSPGSQLFRLNDNYYHHIIQSGD